MYKTRIKEKWWFSQCGRTWLVCRKQLNTSGVTLNETQTHHQTLMTLHSLYGQKYWHPFFRREKALPNCDNKDGNIIHVLKHCISTSVAPVLKCLKWLNPCVQVIGVWWWVCQVLSLNTVILIFFCGGGVYPHCYIIEYTFHKLTFWQTAFNTSCF